MKKVSFFIAIWMTLFFTSSIFSQTDSSTTLLRITLQDGSEFVGNIVEETDSEIFFKTQAGLQLTIKRDLITEQKEIRGTWSETGFLREDPNQTRLFFSPTGKTLSRGKGYFSDYMLFFPFLAYGVSDAFTLSGGMSLFPGATSQIFYFAPKIRLLHRDEFHLSSGVLYIQAMETSLGVGYGVFTYGSEKFAVTGGLGWGFSQGEVTSSPLALIGFETRVGKYVKIISENWIPPNSDVIALMFGIRFFGENLAADLAMVRVTTSDWTGFPFLPWVGFAYNF